MVKAPFGKFLFLIPFLILLLWHPVLADPVQGGGTPICLPNPLDPASNCNGQGTCNDLSCPLNAIIKFLYNLAIPLCTIMVLIGGFQMVTAGGDPEKFSKGRKTILYAALGFAVIILASGVSLLVQSFFTGQSQ